MKKNVWTSQIISISIMVVFLFQHYCYGIMNEFSMQAHLSADWYPTESKNLEKYLNELKEQAQKTYPTTLHNVRACIVPHASYAYSGTIAASCFNLLEHASNTSIDKVIVLAPAHSISFQGIVIPHHIKKYIIPTGTILFDTASMKKLIPMSPFIAARTLLHNPFDNEHSFEIQCPFIHQNINPTIPVIPLLVGYLDAQDIKNAAQALKKIITPQTLIIVSSDFTHYGARFHYTPFSQIPEASLIRALDFKVIESLVYPSLPGFLETIKNTGATVCGQYPIALLLALLENKSLGNVAPHLVAYTTSQAIDSTDKESSVSYAGIVYADDATIPWYEKQLLLEYAKNIVTTHFTDSPDKNIAMPLITPWMQQTCGTFVTWYGPNHTLRGCIGTMDATNSLIENVKIYAQESAFHDPRFTPITHEELPNLTPSITMLTPFKKIKSYKEIKIGRDGILLKNGTRQAVFLPQVPVEFGWNLQTTLEQLSLKAGLPADGWKNKNSMFETCQGYEIA